MSLEEFRNYDFTSDERWNRYRAGIEIPADRNEELILQKYKAKWYQREVDATFDPSSLRTTMPQPSVPQASSNDSGSQSRSQASYPPTSASGRPQPDSNFASSPPSSTSAKAASAAKGITNKFATFLKRFFKQSPQSTQLALFCLHVMLIILAALHLQPLNRKLSRLGWMYFLQTSLVSHGFKVYLKAGFPPLQRSGLLQGLQNWLQRVGTTTDFQYMMLSAMFLPQQSVSPIVVPITILAVYHAFAYCARTMPGAALWRRYGARAYAFLASHQRDALMYNAGAEIGTGFLLIAMIATPRRALLLTFLYWNWLRMRYFSPDAATYHAQVWRIIDQKAGPYIRRVPVLVKGLGFAQRWFLSMGRP